MTDQPTNPLFGRQPQNRGKATIEMLHQVCLEMNQHAEQHRVPWRFAVVPNEDGKMSIRKVDHHAPGSRCTPEQAAQIMQMLGTGREGN